MTVNCTVPFERRVIAPGLKPNSSTKNVVGLFGAGNAGLLIDGRRRTRDPVAHHRRVARRSMLRTGDQVDADGTVRNAIADGADVTSRKGDPAFVGKTGLCAPALN